MQYRVIKQTLLAFSLALLLAAPSSRAAVSVTDVSVAGTGAPYDISYTLNTSAATAKLEIVNTSSAAVRTVSLSGADLSKGPHVTQWDGKLDGGATAPAGDYTARITATGDAVAAGGAALWGPVAVSSNSNSLWYPGVAVNHNVNSPDFGHIYTADYANDTVRVWAADGRNLRNIHYGEFADGVRSVSIGADDRIYALVQAPDDGIGAGVFSMLQDGTDFKLEVRTVGSDYPSMMVVTGSDTNRRFYVASRTADSVNVSVPGDDTAKILINATSDPALGGTVDGLDVLDSNNDPSGHANSVTMYVRTTQGGTSPDSTVQRWDGNNADPVLCAWTKTWDATANLNLGAEYTGFTVSIAPDGNVWVPIDGSNSTGITSRYVKLSKTDGSILDTINAGSEKPRFTAVDSVGNVIAITQAASSTNQTRGRNIWTFAPSDSGSTDAHASASFNFTGVILSPIHITAGPDADAASTTANITWTTDVASNTVVFYGVAADALSQSVTDEALTTAHSITIPGLTKNTPYFYQVRSSAENFASASSTVGSFTTKDVMGAEIVPSATTGLTTATVTWTTPFPTSSVVRYGMSPDALNQMATGNNNATSHTVNISGLATGTTYYYVAQSGSATIETTSSLQYTFATLNPDGTKARAFSTMGDFKFGHMDDVLLTAGGVTLNKQSLPDAVDDAAVPDLPSPRHNATVVAYGGYLYVIGGRGPQVMNTVFYAPINADGTVGAWKETASLPEVRFYAGHGGFGYNGYVYMVAGAEQPSSTNVYQGNTLMARQNPADGSLGQWTVAGSFPGDPAPTRARGAVGVWNGKAYYVAGQNDEATIVHTDTFVADIHPDGTLTWTQDLANFLPLGIAQEGFAAHNGRLYAWGGSDGLSAQSLVYDNVLMADGTLGVWNVPGTVTPLPLGGSASGELHGQLISVGGSDGTTNSSVIYTAEIAADGTAGNFLAATPTYAAAAPLRDLDGASWQGRFYVAGGRTTVGFDGPLDSTAQSVTGVVTFADGSTFVNNGRYESTIMDLGTEEALNTLAVTASGTGVTLSTRSAGADGVFGPWTKQSGLSVTFTAGTKGRYVQFALDLAGGASAPVVSAVALNYGTPGVIPGGSAVDALKIAGGLHAATQADITSLDKNSDGKITVEDAVILARP